MSPPSFVRYALCAIVLSLGCEPADASAPRQAIGPPPSQCTDCAASVDPATFEACKGSCPDGCCSPDGTCAPGDRPEGCGRGGDLCLTCESGKCHEGACVPVGVCEKSCAGCCSAAGFCHAGKVAGTCGGKGGPCATCAGGCVLGACCAAAGASCVTAADCCGGVPCSGGTCG